MLLQYENCVCGPGWKVDEKIAIGYSRVYYIYNGDVFYEDELKKAKLKKGYLYVFPSAIPYRIQHHEKNPLHCTFMHIDFFPSLLPQLIEVFVKNNSALEHIINSITACIKEKNIKLVQALSDVFILYLREHHTMTTPEDPISKVLIYIASHIKEKLTIDTLSSMIGYNQQYFVRLFKRMVGTSPHQYIIAYRLKEAKKMLTTRCSISQIAIETGYPDVKAFSRSFKKNFGVSPSSYRNTYTAKP